MCSLIIKDGRELQSSGLGPNKLGTRIQRMLPKSKKRMKALVAEKLRVMISSTVRDLEPEREAAEQAIVTFCFRRYRSETLPSIARSPQEVCESMASSCDVMVLILGDRYGWVIPALGISVTEREYDVAITSDPAKVLAFEKVPDQREPRQEQFVAKVKGFEGGCFVARPFTTPDELTDQVKEALSVWLSAARASAENRYELRAPVQTNGMHTWDLSSVPF